MHSLVKRQGKCPHKQAFKTHLAAEIVPLLCSLHHRCADCDWNPKVLQRLHLHDLTSKQLRCGTEAMFLQ